MKSHNTSQLQKITKIAIQVKIKNSQLKITYLTMNECSSQWQFIANRFQSLKISSFNFASEQTRDG